MNHNRKKSFYKKENNTKTFFSSIILSLFLATISLVIGTATNGWTAATLVFIPSVLLEAIAGAVASIPVGFDPFTGALVASLGNIAPAPFLIGGFHLIIQKWNWLRKRLKKAANIGEKYGKYGVWILAPLAPFIGVYVGVAVGVALRFRPVFILVSLSIGVIVASLMITYGGGGLKSILAK